VECVKKEGDMREMGGGEGREASEGGGGGMGEKGEGRREGGEEERGWRMRRE